VGVKLLLPELFDREPMHELDGLSLDRLDVECTRYTPAPELLRADFDEQAGDRGAVSNLLKSNCLVTGQPDWGSVQISYSGPQIDQEGLLQYLVSFRNHNEFHEQCVERIFMDIWTRCKPAQAGGVCPLHAPRRAGHQPVSHQPPAGAAHFSSCCHDISRRLLSDHHAVLPIGHIHCDQETQASIQAILVGLLR
jgi:NADPH-dependent 7-cyano-7-deazaguanine reductase QueF